MKIEKFKVQITLEQREIIIKSIVEELLEIGRKKSKDYGGDDPFGNLRKSGFVGSIIRLGDKSDRLMNLITSDTPSEVNESIEDNLLDLINYGFFALIMKRYNSNISYSITTNGETWQVGKK
jgi:hypothetical protein